MAETIAAGAVSNFMGRINDEPRSFARYAMRNSYRHPLAGILLMALLFALIAALFVMNGSIFSFARAVVVMFAAATAAATIVMLILVALRRAGVHRLAEVQTWPQR